jgi:hypothetical protein
MKDFEQRLFSGTKICVLAFASGGGDFSGDVPHYEFGNTLEQMGVSYVLFRDSTHFCCQYGIHGIGDREAVCKYIRDLREQFKCVKTIGLSVGALSAFMYGQLSPVDDVIALSPFSSLGSEPYSIWGQDWQNKCSWRTDVQFLGDLKPIFLDGPLTKMRAFLSDGEGTDQDRHHAERIGITDITLVPGSSHAGLGKLMRDNGMLKGLILE